MKMTQVKLAGLTIGIITLAACSSTSGGAQSTSAAADVSSGSSVSAAAPVASPATSAPATSAPVVPVPAVSSSASIQAAASDLKIAKTTLGSVVVDGQGMTAYYFTKDTANSGKSVCTGTCAKAWPPITTTSATPSVTGVTGRVGTITDPEGSRQITIDGLPIYTFAFDKAPGDVKGQGSEKAWFVISPTGAPIGE